MAAGLVFTGQGRLKGSFFAPARTEIPLFRALVAVVGAARAGVADARKSGFRCGGWHRPGSDPIGGCCPWAAGRSWNEDPNNNTPVNTEVLWGGGVWWGLRAGRTEFTEDHEYVIDVHDTVWHQIAQTGRWAVGIGAGGIIAGIGAASGKASID
jgi:hypothetical protein